MKQSQHRLALPSGSTIHWYVIESVLGKGGFGITYLARDKNLDKLVAIKEFLPTEFATRDSDLTVHPDSSQNDELFRWGLTRFIEEARVLSRFEHPNIVRVHTVFEENNTGYMVMAYEEGRSLKATLQEEQSFDQRRLLDLLLPILDGLQQVHQKQFIHRDIKPDNIYIRRDGSPVLLDFGSARQAIEGESRTMTTMVSPGYAPFEQYHAKGEEQGPWTDIYSFGATAFRAISGINPVDAVTRSHALLDGKPDPLPVLQSDQFPQFSPALLAAVNHALCFRISERPQSIQQWVQELKGQEGVADSTVVVAPTLQTAMARTTQKSTAAGSEAGRLSGYSSGSKTMILGATALLALGGLAGVGYGLIASTGQDSPQPLAAPVSVAAEESTPEQQADVAEKQQEQLQQALLEQQERELQAQQELEAQQEREALARQQEQARLAEQKRQQDAARRKAQEQARLVAQKELEKRMAQSRAELTRREAKKMDVYGYSEYPVAKPLREPRTVKVSAVQKQWTGAGVQVERGQTYRMVADGQWSMGKLCKTTDATGEGMYTLACWDAGGQTVAGYSHGALIGKIGKDSLPFYVGTELTFTAYQDGPLYFMANDSAAFFMDNSGALNVTISPSN